MRRILAILCCLVLATALVARGARVVCPGGTDCCDVATPTTAPATTAPAGCCPEEPSKPAHGEAVSFGMPCCSTIAWDATPTSLTACSDDVVADRFETFDESLMTRSLEPATPPPRATIG